jgi:hypothetical protein
MDVSAAAEVRAGAGAVNRITVRRTTTEDLLIGSSPLKL